MRVLGAGWTGIFKTTVATVVTVMAVGCAGVAAADTGPGDTGGGAVGAPGVVPEQSAGAASQARAKLQLAAAYFDYANGRGSLAAYQQQQRSFAAAYPDAGLRASAPVKAAPPPRRPAASNWR